MRDDISFNFEGKDYKIHFMEESNDIICTVLQDDIPVKGFQPISMSVDTALDLNKDAIIQLAKIQIKSLGDGKGR